MLHSGTPPPLGLVHIQTSDSRELQLSASHVRATRARQAIITRARLLDQALYREGVPYWCAFITLTYREVGGWSARDVTTFNKRLRDHLLRRGVAFPYVWCAELQKRGAVHFHQLVFLPDGTMLPKPDRQGWWTHGASKIERARNAVGYIAKYAGKVVQADQFPAGLRLTGAGGLTPESRAEARWWLLPRYVRDTFGMGVEVRRAPGGGFVNLETGEVVRSPYQFHRSVKGTLYFRRRDEP